MPRIVIDVDFKDKKCEKFCCFYPDSGKGECKYFNEPLSFFGDRCGGCLSAEVEYKRILYPELADV